MKFFPLEATTYTRPPSAGLKTGKATKSRRSDKEPTVFHDRLETYSEPSAPGPSGGCALPTDEVIPDVPDDDDDEDISYLDPYREWENRYMLVHRQVKKNCPKTVVRCESCKVVFGKKDRVLIKSAAPRHFTDSKTGKPGVRQGNVYFHNLAKCLTDHDKKFQYRNVVVLKSTFDQLSKKGKDFVRAQKIEIEE